jgi:Tol biopolymer transport system component
MLLLLAALLLAGLVLLLGGGHHLTPFGPARNGLIAYVSNNHVFLADPDGTHARQIAFDEGTDGNPTFSRDGSRLAWQRYTRGYDSETADLVVAEADGSRAIVLARAVKGLSHPAWSPDGRDIAFSGSIDGGPGSGWIGPSDGSAPPKAFTTIDGAWDPTWSPDGNRLAIGASAGLFVMDRDGSHARKVNVGQFDEIGERGEIAEWSPDGTQLLFTAFYGQADGIVYQQVYVVGLDGRPERLVSKGAELGRDGSWSPDGSRIAYMHRGYGLGPIVYISDTDGRMIKILPGAYGWYQPIWSPDGTKVVVTDDHPGPNGEEGPAVRVILDVEGKEPPIVIPAPGVTPNDIPDWAASWQRIAP